MRRLGLIIEALLYFLFLVDCFALIANGAKRDYFPPGGLSLIVILLLIGIVHRLWCGPRYD